MGKKALPITKKIEVLALTISVRALIASM